MTPERGIKIFEQFNKIQTMEDLIMKSLKTVLAALSVLAFLSLVYVGNASAHCDTLDGPVVATARIALDKGDVTPLLKWVRPEE